MEVFSSNGKEKRNGDSAEDPSITMLTVVKSPALFPLDGNGRKRREKEKRRVMEKDRIGEREREKEVWDGRASNERIRVVNQFIYSRWVGARPA